MTHAHDHHDSCTPDLDRDLVVTGARPAGESSDHDRGRPQTPPPPAAPVVEVTPLSLETEVVSRSAQVPVVVLIGSSVDPATSALRRDLEDLATAARLRWVLGVVDADRFPQVVRAFRPEVLPSVVVVAGGTGVGTWTTVDGEVDCGEWVGKVVATVAGRLEGLPEEEPVDGAGEATVGGSVVTDPRLQEAAELVGRGEAEAALALYDRMLAEYADPGAVGTLRRARAAVAVLARTRDMDRSAVLSAVADARRCRQGEPGTVLRAADVLVLLDRPVEAVELLSGSLVHAADVESIRPRLLEMLHLLDPGHPAVSEARRKLAAAVF
ncbi:tetratricopeptide repeat protein [Corynebacterium sp.]|uniref:tetratricopeptide repeat protein n=1 Tax=Corynebacterium sp. TaxID=1720 RepID=UPI0025BD88D3|nr:tetratricopeptide repeat protein [Corynebacterium sp.]